MDVNSFVTTRRPRWQRLSDLLDRVEQRGVRSLPPQQVDELFSLYRLVSSDLNQVQTRTGNPALLEYLESIVGRAYAQLSVPRRARPFRAWWGVLRHRFPTTLRKERKLLGLAALAMLVGIFFGLFATLVNHDLAAMFLPPEHLVEAPADRVARLEAMETGGDTRIATTGQHARFTTFLFTHNIRVTVLCFALGLTFGIGTVVLLFYNGAMLGSLAALYWEDGVFEFFVAWIGPHGSVELPCILFGATAGLMMARAQWRLDGGTTWQQLRQMRPRLVSVLIGTATFLVVAGTIEGGFSQINEPTIPYPLKIGVAGILFAALLAYLFWMPVREQDESPALAS